jgi:hypothetical protein
MVPAGATSKTYSACYDRAAFPDGLLAGCAMMKGEISKMPFANNNLAATAKKRIASATPLPEPYGANYLPGPGLGRGT